jgi:hypothetical protein
LGGIVAEAGGLEGVGILAFFFTTNSYNAFSKALKKVSNLFAFLYKNKNRVLVFLKLLLTAFSRQI